MRYTGLYLQRAAAVLGEQRVSADTAIAAGRYRPDHAARTGQTSNVQAPGWTGPQLAVQAGRHALNGQPHGVALHLHATINDPGMDFWSPNSYVARELGLRSGMTLGLNAMSNSMIAGIELAASTISAWPGPHRAVITAGDTFEPPRFCAWSADAGMVYGDGASAVVLGPEPGLAELVATASKSDPELEGLNRGEMAFYANQTQRPALQLKSLKGQYVQANGGASEVDRRNASCVAEATKEALYEAGLDLDDMAGVLGPHYGRELLQRHVLDPLGCSIDRTAADLGAQTGHMGASDQIAGLQHWLHHRRLDIGDHVLLLGIGVGMTHTAAVLRISDPTAVGPSATSAMHTTTAAAVRGEHTM